MSPNLQTQTINKLLNISIWLPNKHLKFIMFKTEILTSPKQFLSLVFSVLINGIIFHPVALPKKLKSFLMYLYTHIPYPNLHIHLHSSHHVWPTSIFKSIIKIYPGLSNSHWKQVQAWTTVRASWLAPCSHSLPSLLYTQHPECSGLASSHPPHLEQNPNFFTNFCCPRI